ncbi:hypothetical protein GR11A_00119 [Vibrio phage vB_VcorM_GR11A]|nr:hypothetical protein GR11A_00119 [Vibrio phage vB_VcorM_GR11A]
MIGVEDQWLLSFSLADRNDFINQQQLISFMLIEEAGGALPTFELTFQTEDISIMALLNEGNVLTASLGKNANDLTDTRLRLNRPRVTRLGQGGIVVMLTGFYDAVGWLTSPVQQITGSQDAFTTIRNVAQKYFTVSGTPETSQDSMRWIQPSITDRSFVTDTWLHADLGDGDFPVLGITQTGEFRLWSMAQLVGTAPKHVFSYEGTGDNIVIDGDYEISLNDPLLNQWAGYGATQNVYDLSAGVSSEFSTNIQPLMSFAQTLNREQGIMPKRLPNGAKNGNVHGRWNEAKANNLSGLASFSSNKVKLNYAQYFYGVSVLDLVTFKDDGLKVTTSNREQNARKQLQDYYTGLYVVSKVSRIIKDDQLSTYVELVREAPADMSGSLQ